MEPMIRGDALKEDARRLAADVRAKMRERQEGVGTFADYLLLAFIAELERLDTGTPWEDRLEHVQDGLEAEAFERLQVLLARRAQGRFVDYHERVRAVPSGIRGSSDIGYFDLIMSQGVFDCVQWKGMPLFKTVYDFSLYPMMLWSIKPRTIIELGSGTGASAIWLADLATTFGIDSQVYSVDVKPPDLQPERIRFVEGDCQEIETVFDDALLQNAAHPWIVIEDAHVNVYGVLRYFHRFLRLGDYVVVEDSSSKQEEIAHFLTRQPACYKVDTYFTDFFGRNATCAQDSILVRTDD